MKKSNKPRIKPYFAHDENLEFHSLKKMCNKRASFQSVVKLAKEQGKNDQEVMNLCNKSDLHIITHNTKHFRNPNNKIKVGIICIGLKDEDAWILKFIKMLKKFPKHEDYYNKVILINNQISIKNRKSEDITLM